MSNTYVPERGPDGKITTDMADFERRLLTSLDDTPIEQPTSPPAPRPRLSTGQIAGMVAVPLFLIAVVISAILAITHQQRTPAPVPTARHDLPTATVPSPRPTPSAILSKAIVVYASPSESNILGAVDSTRAYTPTARYGDSDWLQVDVAGSGKVWLHRSDVQAGAVASLPDLAPPPTATPPPAPAPVIVYVLPTAAPPQCPPYLGHAKSIHGEMWSCVSQADAEMRLQQIDQEAGH